MQVCLDFGTVISWQTPFFMASSKNERQLLIDCQDCQVEMNPGHLHVLAPNNP